MSAAAPLRQAAPARPLPTPRSQPAHHRPRLVLVSQRRSPVGRLPFIMLVGTILVVGLVAVLVLHMFAAQYSFRAAALQQRLTALTNQKQQMQQVVDRDSSPTALQGLAAADGMLASTLSGIHRTRDGRVVGLLTPVYPPAPVVPATKTTSAGKSTGKSVATSKAGSKAGAKATSTSTGKAGSTAKAGTTSTTGAATTSGTTTKSGTTSKSGTSGKHHHSHGGGTPAP